MKKILFAGSILVGFFLISLMFKNPKADDQMLCNYILYFTSSMLVALVYFGFTIGTKRWFDIAFFLLPPITTAAGMKIFGTFSLLMSNTNLLEWRGFLSVFAVGYVLGAAVGFLCNIADSRDYSKRPY